jgi:AcrR family transcriptional regulator
MLETRDRLLESSAEMFRRQGYVASGLKDIAAGADAQIGSIYHFFPGGKADLGAETIRRAGAAYARLIPAVFDPAPDVVTAVRDFFDGAAEHLVETNYADACPIATVALEVSSTNEELRRACAEVFESWIALGTERFVAAGLPAGIARQVAIGMFTALEGAFVLARAARDTEALRIAGELAALNAERVLAENVG